MNFWGAGFSSGFRWVKAIGFEVKDCRTVGFEV